MGKNDTSLHSIIRLAISKSSGRYRADIKKPLRCGGRGKSEIFAGACRLRRYSA